MPRRERAPRRPEINGTMMRSVVGGAKAFMNLNNSSKIYLMMISNAFVLFVCFLLKVKSIILTTESIYIERN